MWTAARPRPTSPRGPGRGRRHWPATRMPSSWWTGPKPTSLSGTTSPRSTNSCADGCRAEGRKALRGRGLRGRLGWQGPAEGDERHECPDEEHGQAVDHPRMAEQVDRGRIRVADLAGGVALVAFGRT